MVKKALNRDTKNRKFLVECGVKEQLIAKLNEAQVSYLASFAVSHINTMNLAQTLIQLISLELRGKAGSIFLAANGIATVIQLKNLEEESIKGLIYAFEANGDENITARLLKKILITQQQEKLYNKTGGVKGESHHIHSAGDVHHLTLT